MRQRILITGASAGLGAQMAREFAARGRDLALCARRGDKLAALRAELLEIDPSITVRTAELDVTEHDRVFEVVERFRAELGGLDRVIVNAGLGKGQPLGSGRFDANVQTANTNFTAALAQCEAAMQVFRAQRAGHLVVISSITAMRGMPRNLTTYAATKAGLSALAEGVRAEFARGPIAVTTLHPGYIETELSKRSGRTPLVVPAAKGVAAMVRAIEKEKATASVPAWPWVPLGFALRHLPLRLVGRIS